MLRQIFRALGHELYEALRPYELPRLPEQVTAQLLGKGYRWQILPPVAPEVGVSKSFMQLLSPEGEYVCSSCAPRAVQEKYLADAGEAYAKCGLSAPAVIPGTEEYQAKPGAPAPLSA